MTEHEAEILPPPAQQGRPRVGLFWPLFLIAAGLLLLIRNLGLLDGNIWEMVVRLWPVVLIVLGLDLIFRRRGIEGGIFLIGLGAVFLMAGFKLVDQDVWVVILRLWPLLLVAYGLNLVIGRRSRIGAIFSAILVLALLAGALWWMLAGGVLR